MATDYARVLFALVVAFLLSFAATPIVTSIATQFRAFDIPHGGRKIHKRLIPRLGGLAIFISFIVTVFCFVDISMQLRGILLGAVIIVTLGVIDDICDLKAWVKLIFQVLAALLVIWHGVKIDTITNPFGAGEPVFLGGWSVPITLIWLVAVTNAVNLLDGLDGLAVGISGITAIVMLVFAIVIINPTIAILAAIVAGACFGFLPFNFHPAKIFMGDSGSTFLGFMLASLATMGLFKIYAALSFAAPFLILALPLVDTSAAILRRVLHGQSPMTPDRGHLHHQLIDAGFTQKQVVLTLYTISALLSLSTIVMILVGVLHGLFLIFAVFALAIVGFRFTNLRNGLGKDELNND